MNTKTQNQEQFLQKKYSEKKPYLEKLIIDKINNQKLIIVSELQAECNCSRETVYVILRKLNALHLVKTKHELKEHIMRYEVARLGFEGYCQVRGFSKSRACIFKKKYGFKNTLKPRYKQTDYSQPETLTGTAKIRIDIFRAIHDLLKSSDNKKIAETFRRLNLNQAQIREYYNLTAYLRKSNQAVPGYPLAEIKKRK